MDIRVGGIYRLTKLLGNNGYVFAGENQKSMEEVAIKVEKLNHEITPMLHFEAKVQEQMRGVEGFARTHWFGTEGDFKALVMTIHGPNLQ